MNDIMEKLKNTKILGIIGNALIAVSVFLPFYVVNALGASVGTSLMDLDKLGLAAVGVSGNGIWILLLAILNLVIIFSDKLVASVPALEKLKNQKLALVPAIVVALLIFIPFGTIMSMANAASSFGASNAIALGFGFWTMIIGLVASVAYPFLYKGE